MGQYTELFEIALKFCDAWDKELHCRDIYCEINCPLFYYLKAFYDSKRYGKEIKTLVRGYIRKSIPHDQAKRYLEDLLQRMSENGNR